MNEVIGIVGLGNIGGRLASHLMKKNFRVFGYDVNPKQGEKWGVEILSLEELARRCGMLLLSLPNSKIVEQAVISEQGLIHYCPPGTTIVDLSTSDPESTIEIYRRLKERGIRFLDVGISGGPQKAANGTLTLMAGGDREILEDSLWVLNQIGEKIYYMGKAGSGHTTKCINNFLNGINLLAASEAMIVAKKANLDLAKVLEVFNESSGQNFATQYRFPNIIKGDYMEGGLTCKLMIKDLQVYSRLARSLEVPVLVGDLTESIFNIAIGTGKGDKVSNYIVDVLGDLAGGVRVNS